MYIYVRAQEKTYSVRQMRFALSVTESGYYKWKRNRVRPKAWQTLLADMHKILREHPDNENYGVERITDRQDKGNDTTTT